MTSVCDNLTYATLLKKYGLISDQSIIWSYPKITSTRTENYSWKIHISALVINAIQLAQRFFTLNEKHNFDFKIVSSLEYLEKLNNGDYGNSQVGKFITIYPKKGHAVETLELLHYTFHNEVEIPVGSDTSYKLNSNIYYRYGTINRDILHIDNRDKKLRPSTDAEFILDYQLVRTHQLPKRYVILKSLRQIGPTGTFIGLDTEKMEKVIIRYSTKFYALSPNMVDGNDRLINAYCLLQKNELKKYDFFEKALDIFYVDDSVFIVTKYFAGQSLDQLASSKKLDTFTLSTKINIIKKIATALSKLHSTDIIFQDLSFDNILINSNDIQLIDFEYAFAPESHIDKNTPAGTYGFIDLQNKCANKKSDLFSLYRCFLFLIYPSIYRNSVKKIDSTMTYAKIQEILAIIDRIELPTTLNKIYQNILDTNFL